MDSFDVLYDNDENVMVRFIGFTTELMRYDFGIVYTNSFCGKPLVVCLQTGCSAVLGPEDLCNIEYLMSVFKIKDYKQAIGIVEFFSQVFPRTILQVQYA